MVANRGGDGRPPLVQGSVTVLAERSGGSLEERILDATLRCVARWGVAKTTLDDLAREAGCSRASVYRLFPGGKEVVLDAAATRELQRLFDDLDVALASAPTLEDLLVTAVSEVCRAITGHEAVQYLVQHEPEAIMPYLSFDGLDPLLAWAGAFATPHLRRFLLAPEAAETAEWVARLVVSFGFEPTDGVDLADEEQARRFVRTFVLPGLVPAHDLDLRTNAVTTTDPVPPVPAPPGT